MEYTIKITKKGETMTTAIQYAKKRGLRGDSAKIFSALFNQQPNLKRYLVYIRNDEDTSYLKEWIDRCKLIWKAIRLGDSATNMVIAKTLGTKKYHKWYMISKNPTWADY
jgi:hypothetical protein